MTVCSASRASLFDCRVTQRGQLGQGETIGAWVSAVGAGKGVNLAERVTLLPGTTFSISDKPDEKKTHICMGYFKNVKVLINLFLTLGHILRPREF